MLKSGHSWLSTVEYICAIIPFMRQSFRILLHNIFYAVVFSSLFCLSSHAALAGNADPFQVKAKADRAVALVKQRAAEGKDISKFLPDLERVKQFGDAGRLDEADALLNRILFLLENAKRGEPSKSRPVFVAGMSEITMAGSPAHGIFDPSIASDGTGKLYMSLSGVSSTAAGGGLPTLAVRTYLASSSDQGRNWQLSGVINPDVGVALGRAPGNGLWRSEVSALVFDAQAPAQSRWKLVWHQYLAVNEDRKFEHGWLAYKEAASPGALAAAKTVKLFTASAYDAVNDSPSGWTRSPLPGAAVNKLQHLAPALQDCIVVSEPGLLSKADALYMSLVCVKSGFLGITSDIVVLKCPRPCNAAAAGAWLYAGTALTQADSKALGSSKLSASDLFSYNGKDYLTISPEGTAPVPDAYKGCRVFRFADIATGRIERSATGQATQAASISTDADGFNGACTFLPVGANKGLLIGHVDFVKTATGVDATFRILRSNVSP